MRKLISIFIAIAMMFSLVGVSYAGDGTIDNPIEVLYVYADWEGMPFDTYPDLNVAGLQEYRVVNGTYYINVTSMAGYNPGSWWSEPSAEFYAAAEADYYGYDIVFVDMVDMYDGVFETGAIAAADNDVLLTSIRTGPDSSTCFMPLGFKIRDTLPLSAVLDDGITPNRFYDAAFATAFFDVHDNGPGEWGTATSAESESMAEVLISFFLSL
jgi:hypothetical protein